jgi:hypothetical protein
MHLSNFTPPRPDVFVASYYTDGYALYEHGI